MGGAGQTPAPRPEVPAIRGRRVGYQGRLGTLGRVALGLLAQVLPPFRSRYTLGFCMDRGEEVHSTLPPSCRLETVVSGSTCRQNEQPGPGPLVKGRDVVWVMPPHVLGGGSLWLTLGILGLVAWWLVM